MFLHCAIPAFHAAVHQAADSRLRGRPLAVAIDAGEHAPLVSVSAEARGAGIRAGMRAAAARRQCPGLAVTTPEPDWYRRAQQALRSAVAGCTPLIGGRAGRLDADLTGTERLWQDRLGDGDPLQQAVILARRLRATVGEHLHLDLRVGVAGRVRLARLAARCARARTDGVTPIGEDDPATIDELPLRWLDGLGEDALHRLADCGLERLGEARNLGVLRLRQLLGDEAVPLTSLFDGEDEPVVPDLSDPEPTIEAERHAAATGADGTQAGRLLAAAARDIGFVLRERSLACAMLTLTGRHLDGRTVQRSHIAERQLRHDDELAAIACELATRLARRVHWQRLHLTASRLCAVEDQQELFGEGRVHRLEAARDRLRRRFGDDLVLPLAQAG